MAPQSEADRPKVVELCSIYRRQLAQACELGEEAVKIAIKVAGMDIGDPRRWKLSSRLFAINHILGQLKGGVK